MNNKTTKILQLGRTIFKLRKEKGLSQNQLAEMLDISREHLAKIETSKDLSGRHSYGKMKGKDRGGLVPPLFS